MLKLALKSAVGLVVLFGVFRLLFTLFYPEYFANASLIKTEIYGLRFDLSIISIALCPIFLIAALPFKWASHQALINISKIYALAAFCLICLVCLFDLAYFGEIYRHLGKELFFIKNDISFLLDIALKSRLKFSIFALAFTLGAGWAFYAFALKGRLTSSHSPLAIRLIKAALIIALGIFFARGMILKGRPISYSDAFEGGFSKAQANLVLNPAFVAFRQLKEKNSHSVALLDSAQIQDVKIDFKFTSSAKAQNKNIVFILLESWSYKFIDALSGSSYGATPFMDALSKRSLVFENYFAAGKRSIVGIGAILTSTPALASLPNLGFGLELSNLPRLGEILNKNGYETLLMQSSNRRSFNLNGIAHSLGFKHYFGKEDIPLVKSYPQETPHFGWDFDSLEFFLKKINQTQRSGKKPFFAFLFTGTTHEPFADPGEQFHIAKHDSRGLGGFLNTLYYSDFSLKNFMQKAQQESWYKDSIFIFSADHTLNSQNENLKEQFHIPLIIFDPSQTIAAQKSKSYASQYDLLPSMLDIMGVKAELNCFGRSLFRQDEPEQERAVLLSDGEILGLVSQAGWASFLGQKQLSFSPNSGDGELLKAQELRLKQRVMQAEYLLKTNSWHKSE